MAETFEEVDTALRAVIDTRSHAREWVHTLTLKAIALKTLELYPTATHLMLEDGDQDMTAVTGSELFAGDESLGFDWEDDDDLGDLVRQLDSEQMDEWHCVESSRNSNSPLWKLDLAGAAQLPMKPNDHWADQPDFPVADWQAEVGNGDTRLGYSQWRETKMKEASSG